MNNRMVANAFRFQAVDGNTSGKYVTAQPRGMAMVKTYGIYSPGKVKCFIIKPYSKSNNLSSKKLQKVLQSKTARLILSTIILNFPLSMIFPRHTNVHYTLHTHCPMYTTVHRSPKQNKCSEEPRNPQPNLVTPSLHYNLINVLIIQLVGGGVFFFGGGGGQFPPPDTK